MLPEPLSKMRKLDEAIFVQIEALELFRNLRQINPTQYDSELALGLINLSKLYFDNHNLEQGREVAQEAVEILQRLAKTSPSRYGADLEEAIKLANR